MADLSALQASMDKLSADAATATADVETKFQTLIDTIHGLQAGTITQAQVDALQAQADAVDSSLTGLDAAANAANP